MYKLNALEDFVHAQLSAFIRSIVGFLVFQNTIIESY
ncbi:hypothetical protein HBA_0119 [Sodalis endosymbiont of Henestaris halophilus]|nr:hypothetical protein HBA_0119 [Sodalis endosymbiont of Henestaris halophilus]